MTTNMASNFHMQAESTGTSSRRRTDHSSAMNLLKSENDNMSSSELAVTRGNISENTDNRLISSKFTDAVSDVMTAHKTVEHSHNFNSHCPSSSINFQLKEDVSVITAQMLTDEDRYNDNQKTHSEFSAEDVQTLKCNDSNIQRSWSAEISTKDNESNSIQKIPNNNDNEIHASNITGNINSTENFLVFPAESAQQSKTNILEDLSKAAQPWLHSSTENNLMACKMTPPEESLQCSDFLEIIMDSTMSSPPEKMSTLSASNENTGSLTEFETPATSTSNGTFNCRLITNSVDENFNVAHMPATTLAKNSDEKQRESRSTAQKINDTNMEIKKSKQPPDTVIYSELCTNTHMNLPKDVNVPISYLQPVNTYSQTESLVISKSYFPGLMPILSPLRPPLNVCNSLVEEHNPTILLRSNRDQRKSNAEFCGISTNICNKIYPKTPLIPRNAGASSNMLSADTIHDIRNELDIRTILPEAHTSEITLGKPQASSVNNPLVLTQLQKPSAGTAVLNMTTNSISNLCDPMKVSSSLIHSVASAGPLMTSTISDISPNQAKLKCELKYQPIPNNTFNITPTKTVNLEKKPQKISNYCSATLCGLSPPLSSTDTFPSWASKELCTPAYTENSEINAVNSIQADGAKCAERNLVGIRGRSRGRKTHRYGNNGKGKGSSTRGSELVDAMSHRDGNSRRGRSSSIRGSELVDAMSHGDGNSRRGRSRSTSSSALVDAMKHRDSNSRRGRRSSIRGSELVDAMGHRYGNSKRGCKLRRTHIIHPSVAEQSEGTKRKHTKLTVIKDKQKIDRRSKRTCPRRTKRQGLSNNNKSLTTQCSLDVDQLRFQECLLTGNAEHISQHIKTKRFNNCFLSKSNQEFVRKRRKQKSTLKESTENFTSASPCVPVTNNIKINYEPINNGQQQCPSERKSSLITTDCNSPDTISTENSTAVASSSFQNSEQQMERLSEYSAPLATEYQQHFIPVSDNICNTYAAYYPHEPTSRMLYNDQYFSSYQNNEEEQCAAKYKNIITVGCSSPNTILTKNSTPVATSSFQNSEQQMKRLSEYSAPLATEYQQNLIPVSDNIHNIYTPYYPQETSEIPYNDHYFSRYQNNEGDQCTGKYENTSMWSEIIKFNRDQEFALDEVRIHADQQNEYHEENIIQNGHQNLVNETESNHYAYQLQCKTAKLNNEDLQQVETYRHMDALRCTCNCCRRNQPMSTQNSAICQQYSEILKLDDIKNYELSSTEINSSVGVHQSTVAINKNIHNQQIINNPEYANVLPNTEMFQEGEHWQKLDSCSSHSTAAIQEIYVNNEESMAHNWERHRTSGYPGLLYDDRIQLSIDSNSFFKSEGKFPPPSSQSTENFRLKEVVHLSDGRKVKQKGSKKKCAKNQGGRRGQQKGKSKPDKPYVCLVCGKSEQYNVLLERHIELHHGNSSTHK